MLPFLNFIVCVSEPITVVAERDESISLCFHTQKNKTLKTCYEMNCYLKPVLFIIRTSAWLLEVTTQVAVQCYRVLILARYIHGHVASESAYCLAFQN
jgi:hypothetical protein